jgi:hypothetical protein
MDLAYRITQPLACHNSDTDESNNTQLNASFVHGWNNLPAELKSQIIAYNSTDILEETDHRELLAFSSRRHVLHFITLYTYCNPEFGALMQDAVYSNNTFAIVTGSNKCRLPPSKYRPLIRRLVLKVDMYRYFDRSNRILEGLQDGSSEFTGLLDLVVNFGFVWGRGQFRLSAKARDLMQRKFRLMAEEGHVSITMDVPFAGVHYHGTIAQYWDVARGNIEFGPH